MQDPPSKKKRKAIFLLSDEHGALAHSLVSPVMKMVLKCFRVEKPQPYVVVYLRLSDSRSEPILLASDTAYVAKLFSVKFPR